MEATELDRIHTLLHAAHSPEEVFGQLTGSREEQMVAAKKVYLQMAKAAHPDSYQGTKASAKADLTFKLLARFWQQAQMKLAQGTYGVEVTQPLFEPFVIHTPHCQYSAEKLLASGDICHLYSAIAHHNGTQTRVVLKIPLQPEENDLAANEVRILMRLQTGPAYEKMRHFFSSLVDAFPYAEQHTGIVRNITVLSHLEGFYSLKEVKEAYPLGIAAKHMAWIWRRVLVALSFAHTQRIIHGAVLPPHILLHPDQHGVVLVDWSYAVRNPTRTHEYISAISTAYRAWYPEEVFARETPTPSLDITMAAMCMIDLLGGTAPKHTLPSTIPWQIQHHLQGCLLPLPHQRPQDAHALLNEFDELIEKLWGPRTFQQFLMPKR